jgi:predicted phosphoadenosine phosphosulfate sulfurtransferase
MGSCLETSRDSEKTLQLDEGNFGLEEWQRWDEELVDEFGRWLARLAKALVVLLLAVFAGAAIGW